MTDKPKTDVSLIRQQMFTGKYGQYNMIHQIGQKRHRTGSEGVNNG